MQAIIVFAALVFAFLLVGVSLFLPPQGEVAESVIYVFAQLLIFVASVLGIDVIKIRRAFGNQPRSPTRK